jgi:predicted nucleotidyltransferase
MSVVVELPEVVSRYLDAVVAAIEEHVAVLEAFVLGSAAVGDFDPVTSDLDVVAVIARPLAGERAPLVQRIAQLEPPGRGLELVLYVEGSQPPDYELNVNDGEERPNEPGFWFVLDAAVAQERSQPLCHGRPWSDFFAAVSDDVLRAAMRESLAWSERQPPDDEFARLNAIRSRHYLEHGEWISKTQARELG